jgi:hypothetical protein
MLLPEEFPYHNNWKMSECHPAAREGKNDGDNLATTSMLRNAAKANWTLEELGWELLPPGNLDLWDGLMEWYIAYAQKSPEILKEPYLDQWYRAACRSRHQNESDCTRVPRP